MEQSLQWSWLFFFLHSSSSMFAEARAWTCSWLVGFFTIPLYALPWKSLKSKKPKNSETPWNWTSVHYASRLWGITLLLSQERGLVCQAVAKVCAERLGGNGNACLGPLRWPCKVHLLSLGQNSSISEWNLIFRSPHILYAAPFLLN